MKKTRNRTMTPINVVDLFCGVGGLTHGLETAGVNVVAGIDADPSCRYAYERNNRAKFIEGTIETTQRATVEALFPKNGIRVLAGCAPCQPFSTYGKLRSEERWKPLYEFARLIREVAPDIVTMENVPQLQRFPVYRDFCAELERIGYTITASVVNCLDYGIPQHRQRLVLFASKFGPLSLIPSTHTPEKRVTVRDAIGKLPAIEDGTNLESDPLHRANKLSDLNRRRIRSTPMGGGWADWDDELKLECHKKKSGKTYQSVYGRMHWDKPAPTMTTHCVGLGNGRFGHPDQHRAISLREAALFQTFPMDYDFVDPSFGVRAKIISRQIGNAVPVLLGKVIAQSIQRHVEQYHGKRS